MRKPLLRIGIGYIMLKLALILSSLAILCCPFAAASEADFSSIDAFLKSTLKGEDRLSVEAKGDLNGDRLEDWAGVIHRQKSSSSPTYQLYVLLRLSQGGYRIAEKSKEAEIAGAGCCWVENLEIRRSSIYVQNNAKTASTMEAATHQFKLYKGEWRLVGIRIYYTDLSPDAPATTDTDMNLLTGSVIEKRQKGENRPITKRRHKKFAIYLLKDFDFYNGFGNE
ncbi:MAG TPA: hypothetical protein VE842_08650 [Pyrinomonadaceae bacterium]|nr:hypothetical protein [Pyrinomonadaceae bacterium]